MASIKKNRIYRIWSNIKTRCYNSNNARFKDYGKRGITMCDEWKYNFNNFENWAIKNGYKDNLSIDRIDNNGNYEPNNCKWSTTKYQNRNKRNTIKCTINNIQYNLIDVCEKFEINYDTVLRRLKLNWDLLSAIDTKVKRKEVV